MKTKTTLFSFIYKHYLIASLIPLLLIELVLVVLYFSTNSYIANQNKQVLSVQAEQALQDIVGREAELINQQLHSVANQAHILQAEQQRIFQHPERFSLPNGEPIFKVSDSGVFYKTNEVGASLYYSAGTIQTDETQTKARMTEAFDVGLKNAVEFNPNIVAAYFNSYDDMNRLYPFMDVLSVYAPAIHMEDFNFYYLADAQHNPERTSVWTNAYLDPAGNGWMMSCIVPIYRGDFLEGVTGLDVTIEHFVENILNLKLPYESAALMVDQNGMIMAMNPLAEELFGRAELKNHDYQNPLISTIEKPEDFSLLRLDDGQLRQHFKQTLTQTSSFSQVRLNQANYYQTHYQIAETGWHLMTLTSEALVNASSVRLEEEVRKVGIWMLVAMAIFYTVFLVFLLRKAKRMARQVSHPIEQLNDFTKTLSEREDAFQLEPCGIKEIDQLSVFSQELQALNQALKKQTVTDQLTGLKNRLQLDRSLSALEQAQILFSLIYIDVDDFKQINDRQGHLMGDKALTLVAQILQENVENPNVLGRWGGEEFLIVMPSNNPEAACALAQDLCEHVAGCQLTEELSMTISVGVAIQYAGESVDTVLCRADEALYRAKANGKNQVVCDL